MCQFCLQCLNNGILFSHLFFMRLDNSSKFVVVKT